MSVTILQVFEPFLNAFESRGCAMLSGPEPTGLQTLDLSFSNTHGSYDCRAYYKAGMINAGPVVFTGGLGTCYRWYYWLIEALTGAGYPVAAFTVPKPFSIDQQVPQWVSGFPSCIDVLTSSSSLRGIIDPSRIACVGHSAGAMGALIASTRENRIKAVSALAPPYEIPQLSLPFSLTVPVQFQFGTEDPGYTAMVQAFPKIAAPSKSMNTIQGGNHSQFMDSTVYSFIEQLIRLGLLSTVFDNQASMSLEEQHTKCQRALIQFLGTTITPLPT